MAGSKFYCSNLAKFAVFKNVQRKKRKRRREFKGCQVNAT
jgi:hypothetical protein